MARIISQIGDQLISNEEVALLELIKNSYDARADYISIIIDQVDRVMIIEDNGKGMTKEQLENNWLVLGTDNRYQEKTEMKDNNNTSIEEYVPLGEKGLGRFSTKKLGKKLRIETKSKADRAVNILEVDWKDFDYNSTKFLDEVKINIYQERKENDKSFTVLYIEELNKLHKLKVEELKKQIINKLVKFINPFQVFNTNKGIKNLIIDFEVISPKYNSLGDIIGKNSEIINTEKLSQTLLEQAHNKIYGTFDGLQARYSYEIKQNGVVVYSEKNLPLEFDRIESSLKTIEGEVGAFDFCIYNFQRQRLGEIKGLGNVPAVRKLIENYCGGVMIYRDGFRVLPYGNEDNDWLKQNTNELRTKGVRFYTLQTVGYVNISSLRNKNLSDQTNRQGLQENEAYYNLVGIMSDILKQFANKVQIIQDRDKETIKRDAIEVSQDTVKDTIIRVEELERQVKTLKAQNAGLDKKMQVVIGDFDKSVLEIKDEMLKFQKEYKLVKKYIESVKNQEEMLIFISAVGLAAEMISHELHHLLDNCVDITNRIKKIVQNKELQQGILYLNDNVKSIRTLVSRIDDHGVSRRRVRVEFDLVNEIDSIFKNIKYQLKVTIKNNVVIPIEVYKKNFDDNINVRANKGMITQVFMNLINNSIYWLNVFSLDKPDFKPKIFIEYYDGIIVFYDNGKGIQELDKDSVFEPFFSRKKDGRGLGLYIVKEICNYHKVDFYLSDDVNGYGRYYKFCIDISNILDREE